MSRLLAVLFLSWLLMPRPQAEVSNQQAMMVWNSGCIKSISKQAKTRVEAPMKDGAPDWTQMRVYRELIELDTTCGHIEVRRVK